jgi:hypothetical protein
MTDLDASYSKQAKIQIYEEDNALAISWSKMRLISKQEIDSFSFQLTLMSNGTIIFCYQDVPIGSISKITSSGLNIHHQDSLVYNAKKAFTNKTSRTLYKYHGFDLKSNAANI